MFLLFTGGWQKWKHKPAWDRDSSPCREQTYKNQFWSKDRERASYLACISHAGAFWLSETCLNTLKGCPQPSLCGSPRKCLLHPGGPQQSVPLQPCCVKCILHSWCQSWNSAHYLCDKCSSGTQSSGLWGTSSVLIISLQYSSYLDEITLMRINVPEDLHLQCWRGWAGHYCLGEQHRAEMDAIWKLRIKFNITDILQYTFLFSTRKQRYLQSAELI